MKVGTQMLRDEVSGGVTRLIGLQLLLTLVLLATVTLVGGYFFIKTELEYKKQLISTRISTELSSMVNSLNALAESPVLWTALTDTTDEEAFLTPLLQSLNRSEAFKVSILDYRGREILMPQEPLADISDYQFFLRQQVGARGLSFSVFNDRDGKAYVGILFPIVSPMTDSVVGHVLSIYSLGASLAQLSLSDETNVAMSLVEPESATNTKIFGGTSLWTMAAISRDRITTLSGDYVFFLHVSKSYGQAVLWFLLLLGVIAGSGLIALRRGRRWANDFSRRTLSRFDQLLVLSRQIIQGQPVETLEDDRGDEISEIRQTLGKLLTEQRQTFEKIRTSASVFKTAGEAIMITSSDGKIVDANPALIQLTGYDHAELIGMQAGMLYRSDQGSAPDQKISSALDKQGHWRGETEFFDHIGTRIPVQLAVTRVFGDNGQEEGQVAVFTDIRQIKEAEEKLRRYAYQDVLTGLPNYRAFAEALGRRINAENAADHPFILIFIDLDRLKQINDSYGHEKGDQVIRDVANHISEVLPPGHLLCRRSGDEFLAIVDFKNDDDLEALRRRLDRRLDSYMIAIEMETLQTSISAGVTIYPTFSRHYGTLLQQADAALYEAKRDRTNRRVVWFTSALGEKIERRLKIETVLEKAIVNGKIIAHYQPEVEMPSGRVIGFEALARWQDPILGAVGPTEFIEVAEENGLIGQLTKSIVTQVLDAMPLIRAHVPGATVSVNVSPQLFINRQITDMLIDLMDERQFDLDGLIIEITESDLSQHYGHLSVQLNTIRGLGVKVAIDDFGKGHSSLSRLINMPLDKLKLDSSFVSGNNSRVQKDIVDVIMTLSHKLGLSVTAEGVETEEQMLNLIECGCRHAQGWYFSKAITLEQVLAISSHLKPATRD